MGKLEHSLYIAGLLSVAIVLACLLAACSSVSFRLGELSFEGASPENTIGIDGSDLK